MSNREINKENIDFYLHEFAKEFKKISKRKAKIEIIIIGGGSALINYGFRNSTYDIDAIMFEKSISKEAARIIADRYGLPDDWLNNDFIRSSSYSEKLILRSVYYKTFCNCVDVRTVKGEYLVAMKLKSGRIYKHDLSDIVGILYSEAINNNKLKKEDVLKAYKELYGTENLSEKMLLFFNKMIEMDTEQLIEEFNSIQKDENENKELLVEFNDLYHIRLDRDKINETIESFKESKMKKDM